MKEQYQEGRRGLRKGIGIKEIHVSTGGSGRDRGEGKCWGGG